MIVALMAAVGTARGQFQQSTPIYADDSPQAQGALERARELASAGNVAEAARVIQQLLDLDAERVIPDVADPKLYVCLRDRAHETLRSTPALLDRYRSVEEPRARDQLAAGDAAGVERSRLLTRSGLDAALVVAGRHLESARFEAARLTLEQLESHPDRSDPQAAGRCAEAARRVARYLDRPEVRAWADRWTTQAGGNEAVGDAVTPPARAAQRAVTPVPTRGFAMEAGVDAGALVRSPLQSVWISEQVKRDLADRPELHQQGRDGSARQSGWDEPWIYPTVFGDLVYVTDGTTTTALDRYTLAPVWSTTPKALREDALSGSYDPLGEETLLNPGIARQLDDAPSVVVGGGVAVSCSGLPYQNGRDDAQRVHAFDAATGRELWSAHLAQLAGGLESAGIRGTPVIDGDTLILGVKKTGQARRLLGLYLIGVDLKDGSAKWTRLVGSAGVLPRGGSGRVTDSPVVERGIVYRADEMGVVAAVEAATGRPRWVRTFEPGEIRARDVAGSWSTATPILDAGRLVTLSPDRQKLLVLEAATGRVIAAREARSLGDPVYLVRVGEHLACVGERVVFVPLAQAESAAAVDALNLGEAQPVGRAVAAGGTLVAPTREGLMILDPATPGKFQRIELAHSGNVIVNGEHILAVDATRVHSYLVWDRAEKLVRGRIEASPGDPRPALTYAELAYRAGKTDRVVPAMDIVIKSISADAATPIAAATRAELFALAADIVSRGLRGPDAGRSPLTEETGLEYAPPIRDLAVLDAVLARLTRCAEADREQTRALLLTADLRRAQSAPDRAAAAYQEIIQSPPLASSLYVSGNTEVRAEVEAARLLRELVRTSGVQSYAAFDAEAARTRAELGAAPTREALLDLVRRYPAAAQNAEILGGAAQDLLAAGDRSAAAALFEQALISAEEGVAAGRDAQVALVGRLGGRLVGLLQQQDRPATALRLTKRLATQYPRARAAFEEQLPGGMDSVARELEQKIANASRPARVGTKIGPDVQTLEGWTLLRAIVRDRTSPPAEHVLMYAPGKKQLALWSVGGDPSGLTLAWGRDVGPAAPTLVRIDGATALLFWTSPSGGELERVDLADGKTLWRTESFDAMSPAGQAADDPRARVETPLDGQVKLSDLLIALDDQVAVLTQRGGRIAGVDLATGKALWAAPESIGRVFDLAVGGGRVVLVGATEKARDDGMGWDRTPVLRELDVRTGQVLRSVSSSLGHFRWIRLAGDDLAVVGVAEAIVGLDLKTGKERWVISGEAAKLSIDAWVIGQKLVFMDQRRDLWVGSALTGAMGVEAVSTNSRVGGRGPVHAQGVGDSIVFTGDRGLLVIGPSGELTGMDPMGALSDLITPVLADRYAVTVESDLSGRGDQQTFKLMLLDTRSGKLEVQQSIVAYASPRELAVLDGRVVVTCGAVTLVIPAR